VGQRRWRKWSNASRALSRIARARRTGVAGTEPLLVHGLNAVAVEAPIQTATLRDLKNDRAAFQHDILRDWAAAERLSMDLTLMGRLPLVRPASSGLARSIELAARRALERSADDTAWRAILERVSATEIHGSWRRAVLLALVRSEIGADLLKRAEGLLLAKDGALLRELIRTVMAIEVEPDSARRLAGVPASVPLGLKLPLVYSWARLLAWLLGSGDQLPTACIPVVTELFLDWPAGSGDRSLATPVMVEWFMTG
jgi:hypothetical protein